jgi:hypothetical protein
MKRHARKAFTALKKIGAPVFVREGEEGPYFCISAEDNGEKTWADYYMMTDGPELEGWRFGVCAEVIDILDANGLYCEWENPGSLSVYDG